MSGLTTTESLAPSSAPSTESRGSTERNASTAQVPALPAAPSGQEVAGRMRKIDEWRDHFAAMPKRTIRLQEDEVVMVNGYGFHIKGKERVQVPELVAEILEQSGLI